jgi:superkiller protein 3
LSELDPDAAEAQTLLGDIYLSLAQWDAAAQAYEAALALEDTASTRIVLGMARMQLGQVDAAIEQYQAVLAAAPENAAAWQSLGDAFAQQGNLAEATQAYEQALALADNASAHSQLAVLYLQQGETDQAVVHYEQAIALDPSDATTQVRLGGLYASQGRLAEADAAFRSALAVDPENADAYAGLANAAYRQCSINTAVQSLGTAASLAPRYRGALAATYEAQGRNADAEALYAELGQASAEDALAHLAVAEYQFRRGQLDEAARTYQRILESGNAASGLISSLIYSALGQIDMLEGRFFVAEGAFEQALAAFPANVEARIGIGDLALRVGDAARALDAYDAALLDVPRFVGGLPAENASLAVVLLHARRSLAFAKLGDDSAVAAALDQALAQAEAAVSLTPRSPLAQFALGAAHVARGETDAAEIAFARAVECDQALAVARDRLVDTLAKLQTGE